MRVLFCAFLIFAFGLTSCEANLRQGEEKTQTAIIHDSTTTVKPFITRTLTSTPPIPTISPTLTQPTNTSQPTPEEETTVLTKRCMDVSTAPPKRGQFPGHLFLKGVRPVLGGVVGFYNYDPATLENSKLPYDDCYQLPSSPDGMWYACGEYSGSGEFERIKIFSTDGKLFKTIDSDDDWDALTGWQNNEQLRIITNHETNYIRSFVFLNPFTEKWIEAIPNLPGIGFATHENEARDISYDPKISRAVYPAAFPELGSGVAGNILYDVEKGQILAKVVFSDYAEWSPDGSKVILSGNEFFLVSREGLVEQITHLNRNWSGPELVYPVWSPTGENVAIWLHHAEDKDTKLVIMDMTTYEMTDTCIISTYKWAIPVWSPDGKSLAILANLHRPVKSAQVLLIDLEDWKAFTIAENIYPVAWLK